MPKTEKKKTVKKDSVKESDNVCKTNKTEALPKAEKNKELPPKKQQHALPKNQTEKLSAPRADAPHSQLKVLFVAGEAAPYIRTGGLGDVAGALPKELVKNDVDVRVIIPLYDNIPSHYKQLMQYLGYKYVPLAWRNQYCGVFMQKYDGVTYYFIDNEYYFKRSGVYGHFDDAERFAFFSRAVLEVLPLIDFYPDVIHCNDWHTALIPVFLDSFYREVEGYANIKTMFTIHNIEFQGKYDISLAQEILGLPEDKYSLVEYKGCVNFMKGGIEASNIVTTVSETYSKEITDPFYAYGLEDILSERYYKIHGIINGIDEELYNPLTDPALFKNYSCETIEDKEENKKGICKMLNLPYLEGRPLMSMISRLTSQKGLDLVMNQIEELLKADLQLVILGTGDWFYETALRDLESRYGNKLKVIIQFQRDLASKLYAASDIFLMPSKFEPCGLSQLIALRYGAIPVVRETGGLKDTVKYYNFETREGNGFSFANYSSYDMINAIWVAVNTYYEHKDDWKQLIKNAMYGDFSWKKSAQAYLDLYRN